MTVDRANFTPTGQDNPDTPVPCGDGRTVPTERMAMLLAKLLGTKGSVLEIGTGSGYQTAVLAELCDSVLSVETTPYPGVEDKLPDNVSLVHGDGCEFDSGQEFDGVLVTFAASTIRTAWVKQIKDGGRLVIPLKAGAGRSCRICVYERRGDEIVLLDVAAYAPFTDEVN